MLRGRGTVFFIDESRMVYGVGVETLADTPSKAKSYYPPQFSSVFQAEALAILQGCRLLNMAVLTDTQVVIKASYTMAISSG